MHHVAGHRGQRVLSRLSLIQDGGESGVAGAPRHLRTPARPGVFSRSSKSPRSLSMDESVSRGEGGAMSEFGALDTDFLLNGRLGGRARGRPGIPDYGASVSL